MMVARCSGSHLLLMRSVSSQVGCMKRCWHNRKERRIRDYIISCSRLSRKHHFTRQREASFTGRTSQTTWADEQVALIYQHESPTTCKMPYDLESGLVFDEKVVSSNYQIAHRTYCNSELRARPIHHDGPSPCSAEDADSLYNVAMRLLLRSVNCLEPDVLKSTPNAMLDRIWRAGVRS